MGWKIFPCIPGGKAPLTANGFKDATTTVGTITTWWSRWPTANLGYQIPDKVLVFDIDPRNGGSIPEGLTPTLTCLTGGGGYHYYYTLPDDLDSSKLRALFTAGVDIKKQGGYTLVPPSITNQEYVWANNDYSDTKLPTSLPIDLISQVSKPQILAHIKVSKVIDPLDSRPGTLFNQTATWEEILEPDGWTKVRTNVDGEIFWCRPGKSNEVSATTNYSGSELLYIFTSSTEFESNTGYSKFAAYTLLKWNGDYQAAAAELASTFQPTYFSPPVVSNMSEHYTFTPALPPDNFVSRFIEYVDKQTDAPKEYAEASALTLISLAGYRSKAALAPYPGGLGNNLYVVLVGPTTKSRKSTVQRIAGSIAKAVMPPSLLPNRATTEALIKALANRNGVPSVWTPDEFGVTLAEIYNRDYMRGLEEMLLTVYSGDDYEYQRVLDSVIIKNPHLSILGAATPESISRSGTSALDSGLLPRFAIVYPSVLPETRVVGQALDLRAERQGFISQLNSIMSWSNTHNDIAFSTQALDVLNSAEQKLTATSAARLPTMLYKVASLLAIADMQDAVSERNATSAVSIVTRWADGVATLIPQMYRHGTDQQFEQQLDYVLGEIVKAGGELHRVQIANSINVKKQRLDEIKFTLLDKGKITSEIKEGGEKWMLRENN